MKKVLMPFYEELTKNLEIFYVMDQRQFIDMEFQFVRWQQARSVMDFGFARQILDYAKELEDFNRSYRDFKEYERWYASDLKNKSPENARKLHEQKHALEQRLKQMDKVIISAGEQLELKLLELKFIK